MNRFRYRRILIGVILASFLMASATPIAVSHAQDVRTVPAQFRVWEGTRPGGDEWEADLNGKISVFALGSLGQSPDGRYIIAPGTGGSYAFTVQNLSPGTMTYLCTISGDNPYSIPLEVRLHTIDGNEDGYFIGSPNTWVPVDQMGEYSSTFTTQGTETLVLEWWWPFEVSESQDTTDTALGIKASNTTVPYDMVITIQAEDVTEEVPSNVTPEGSSSDVQSGDTFPKGRAIALLVISVGALCVLALSRRKGADHD